MKMPLPLQSYPIRSVKQNSQSLINMFSVPDTAGGKTDMALYPTPGLLLFGDTGLNEIRGSLEVKDVYYLVASEHFGVMDSTGVFTSKGTLDTSTGRVKMAAIFDEILIATGGTAYHYKISTDTFSTVVDADFPTNCSWVMAQDEYFFALNPDTDEFFLSNLSDGLSWSATSFASAEVRPDPLVAAMSVFQEVWLFGTTTTEIWFNTGNIFPFEQEEGSFMNYGCAAPHSVVMAGNTAYWLGRSENGSNMVMTVVGTIPAVVSNEAMNREFDTYGTTSDAFAYSYHQGGHEFYVITFPTANKTWMLNLDTKLWSQLNSYNTQTHANPSYTRHRANCYAFCYGKHLVGDFVSGKVFELNTSTYYDDSDKIIQREIITPNLSVGGKRVCIYSLELFVEPGKGLTSGQGSDPKVYLEVSRDGGFTYGNKQLASIGKKGEYLTRTKWNRLGTARDFVFRITMTDPVEYEILGAEIEVDNEPETPSGQ